MAQTLDTLIKEVEAGEQHLTYEGLKGRDTREAERLVDGFASVLRAHDPGRADQRLAPRRLHPLGALGVGGPLPRGGAARQRRVRVDRLQRGRPRFRLAAARSASPSDEPQTIRSFLRLDPLGGDPQRHRLLGGPGALAAPRLVRPACGAGPRRPSCPRCGRIPHRSTPSVPEPSRSSRSSASSNQGRSVIFAGGRWP